jgi:hypothetical protein
VGKIAKLDIKSAWANEVAFTMWLERNIDALGDAIRLRLTNVERERNIGDFSLDLSAEEEGTDRLVVVENQIERSDHDHLGKLITYLAGIDGAKVAVWIVRDPRPEHVKAVSWLNTSVEGTEFYLVKLEAISIEDSPPAALLTQIVGPSEATRGFKATKKELAERNIERLEFWRQLLDRAKLRTNLHSARSPSPDSWISSGAGRAGLSWSYTITEADARVELSIDTGDEQRNQSFLNALLAQRDAIETAFGSRLEFDQKPERRSCKVYKNLGVGGRKDRARWEAIQDAMIEAMIRLHGAIDPMLRGLPAA